jgi:hypothetical protein
MLNFQKKLISGTELTTEDVNQVRGRQPSCRFERGNHPFEASNGVGRPASLGRVLRVLH